MSKLIAELQRLYFLRDQQWHSRTLDAAGGATYLAEGAFSPVIMAKVLAGEAGAGLDLVSPEGMARVMALCFKRAGDWDLVANLYQAVQNDLNLPAPAVSVSGRAGYRIWFSLIELVAVTEAWSFLEALRVKYLLDIPSPCLELHPDAGRSSVTLVPALHHATGKWSAFIDPSMGSMFVVEPGLEMAPNLERQASMLAALESTKAGAFQRALGILRAEAELADKPAPILEGGPAGLLVETTDQPALATERTRSGLLNVGNNSSDPTSFLLAVMNDPSASMRQRIRAAKALLPYVSGGEPNGR